MGKRILKNRGTINVRYICTFESCADTNKVWQMFYIRINLIKI